MMCFRAGVDDNPAVDDQGKNIPGFRINNEKVSLKTCLCSHADQLSENLLIFDSI